MSETTKPGDAAPASEAASVKEARQTADRTQIRFLTPENCRIHLGNLGALHVTVKSEGIYGGIYTAYAFPVAYPNGYISIVQTAGDQDTEVGVIRDLAEFPERDAALVREALARRYFIHTVTRLLSIEMKYNMLFLEVSTDKGDLSFFMRWAQDRAVDFGQNGKVLIDVDDNRYLIPDLEKLSLRERVDFQRFIYW
jgi:ATP-binding cassette, subfamily B, bacterial